MTGNDIMNIIKSPTSKVLLFGSALIAGALIAIPHLTRDDAPLSVQQQTELTQEEKAALEIQSGIPRFQLDRQEPAASDMAEGLTANRPPPIINGNAETAARLSPASPGTEKNSIGTGSARENVQKRLRERGDQEPRERDLSSLLNRQSERDVSTSGSRNPVQSRIFVMSATAEAAADNSGDEAFLSERYAPYGRLLDCKLVNTLESNVDGTPLIALVIEDLWWTNAEGERKLIIPAGTEIHGKMGSCVRNRMMSEGNFILVWQITSNQVGMELQLQGRILEKSNQAGNKGKATITDMAAGIPGRVMQNNNLNEMLQYTMAFAQGLAAGFETTTTYDNGSTIVSKNDGSTKNALATAFESLSNVALENITDKISKEAYYIRVAAGTEFYLYIEQVTNIEKAAIADTALNNLEQVRLAQEGKQSSSDAAVDRASLLHDALGQAIPRSLQKELKGIR